ncbi:MAG: nicotinate-nucleotide adenylyltransferase [Lachnospiraceae bacterium]|nr:nicotinate-nucleotide adenylyltransferase [Lachnospiraceae bacterium]
MAKIGLMGGTFNPIHNAHLQIAQEAMEEFGLDQVLFIPAGQPYMNKDMSDVLPAQERASMTKLAIRENPGFAYSDLEVTREGISYTCDTLRQLIGEDASHSYYLLLGADSFMSLYHWKESEYLFAHAVIGVTLRSSVSDETILETKKRYEEDYQAKILVTHMPTLEISSSDIRKRVREGRSIRYLVPECVAKYIEEKNLYR